MNGSLSLCSVPVSPAEESGNVVYLGIISTIVRSRNNMFVHVFPS